MDKRARRKPTAKRAKTKAAPKGAGKPRKTVPKAAPKAPAKTKAAPKGKAKPKAAPKAPARAKAAPKGKAKPGKAAAKSKVRTKKLASGPWRDSLGRFTGTPPPEIAEKIAAASAKVLYKTGFRETKFKAKKTALNLTMQQHRQVQQRRVTLEDLQDYAGDEDNVDSLRTRSPPTSQAARSSRTQTRQLGKRRPCSTT